MTREELERRTAEFMDSCTTMTLACSLEDTPWAAAVYYARKDLDLIFFSSPRSRHATVLADNPAAAATIHGEYARWQDIKGLQLEGTVRLIEGAVALARAAAVYLKRYPFVKDFLNSPAAVSAETAGKMSRVRLYMFHTRSIRYLDNSAGFGTRWKMEVKGGKAVGDVVLE